MDVFTERSRDVRKYGIGRGDSMVTFSVGNTELKGEKERRPRNMTGRLRKNGLRSGMRRRPIESLDFLQKLCGDGRQSSVKKFDLRSEKDISPS
jgi:hypothetical protein